MGEEIVLKKYIVCGPFPYASLISDGYESFFIDYLSEIGGEERAVLRPGMRIRDASCFEVSADESGVVDFVKIFGEEFRDFWRLNYGVAYAYTEIEADEGNYILLIGSEDYVSVFTDEGNIFTSYVARSFRPDFYAVSLRLKRGVNRILFKSGRLAGRWLLSAKLIRYDKPLYIHRARILKPDVVRGSKANFYLSVPVLALSSIKRVVIECVEDEIWRKCFSEIRDLVAGAEYPVPIHVSSKRVIDGSEEIKLKINVYADDLYIDSLEIPIRVVNEYEHRIESYRSVADGSVHLYGLKPPKKPCLDRRCGAVISLHGFKGHPYFSELYGDKEDLYIISPTARDGEVNYREIGLIEVLEVIDQVLKRYEIDPDRIYLSGHSMGGYGTWYIGTRIPHLFAAIAPLSSRGDLSDTIDLLRKRSGWEGVAELINLYNPATLLRNLSSTPVFVSHGSDDKIVSVDYSRNIVKKLSELNIPHVYEEVPGVGHVWGEIKRGSRYGLDCIDRESIESFFREKRRNVPRKLIAEVIDHRFNKIWWVTIYGGSRKSLSRLSIELSDNEINTLIIRESENVSEFEIDLAMLKQSKLIDPSRGLVIVYGEKKLVVDRDYLSNSSSIRIYLGSDKDLCLIEREDLLICSDQTKIIRAPITERLVKRKPVTGPLLDAFNSESLIVSCSNDDICIKSSLHIQRWWFNYSNGYIEIVFDKDLLNKRITGKNLILIGGPEKNLFLRRIIDLLDIVRFEGENKIILGSKTYEREKIGIAMIYPNPIDPAKYIVLLGGNSRESIEALQRLALTIVPDYLIYDSRLVGRDPGGVIASGFFNYFWRLDS
ncbi:MAG: prolyl oligopeptidase family serine peptidase [Sulfolobales archaeon]